MCEERATKEPIPIVLLHKHNFMRLEMSEHILFGTGGEGGIAAVWAVRTAYRFLKSYR